MGEAPDCACGCGGSVMEGRHGWNRFIHGHHRRGTKKSEDERRRTGEKNRSNMRRFMSEHPDVAAQRVKQMHSALTPEIISERSASMRRAYETMSDKERQALRNRTKQRWESGELARAHAKATETFKQRAQDGRYDFKTRNQNLSEVITRKYIEGGFEWSRGHHMSTKTGRIAYFRSSWEMQLMQELDADPDVIDWKSEFTTLSYQLDGVTHRYIPDFHIVRHSTGHWLIEVKPKTLRETTRNTAKRLAAMAYCTEQGWLYVEWEPTV